MLCNNCNICKNAKATETVVAGRIEHKTESGEIWMTEPLYKTVPAHCPVNQTAYEAWHEKVKDMSYDEYISIDCDCEYFEANEFSKGLNHLLDLTNDLLNEINKDKQSK